MAIAKWKTRELKRFESGQYTAVPWAAETWARRKEIDSHFPHVSEKNPSQIAFTENSEKGDRDIQTPMRPGKYLRRFYDEILDERQITEWAGKFAAANESIEVKFAHTPDEIERVYREGPNSCMAYSIDEYAADIHPTRVYGAGDLAIAYIESEIKEDNKYIKRRMSQMRGCDCEECQREIRFLEERLELELKNKKKKYRITARCLAWPEKNHFSVIYGDRDRLESGLDKLGYERGGMEGARLLKHKCKGVYVMPYIDDFEAATVGEEFIFIDCDGELSTQSTNGLTSETPRCENCGDGIDPDYACSVNHEGVDQSWCEHCRDNDAFYCDDCCDTYSGSPELERDFACICSGCATNYFECDNCHEYRHDDSLAIAADNGDSICDECEGEYFCCDECGEYFPNDEICTDKDSGDYCGGCDSERKAIAAKESETQGVESNAS